MSTPEPRATLRYDSACPFCAASARFIEARAHGAIAIEAARDLPAAELRAGASVRRGGGAVTAALALLPGWGWVRFLDAPGVRLARDAAYALVTRARWLVPRAPQ